jgi:NAD(P)-dependent dehydrogenase (short-subunit alcohol dehydrogenase family)
MIRARAGHILNIGTFASERMIEAPVHYAASKAALRGLTEALAREVGRYGIRSTCWRRDCSTSAWGRCCCRIASPST